MGAGASSHVRKLHKEILQEAIKRKVVRDECGNHVHGSIPDCVPAQDEDEEYLRDPEVAIVLRQQVTNSRILYTMEGQLIRLPAELSHTPLDHTGTINHTETSVRYRSTNV